jgi:hypothetical protein
MRAFGLEWSWTSQLERMMEGEWQFLSILSSDEPFRC